MGVLYQKYLTYFAESTINLSGAKCRISASVNYGIIGSDIVMLPVRRQDITWTNAGLL